LQLVKIKQGPDVVILDIKMPGMDGHEALAKIKKLRPALPAQSHLWQTVLNILPCSGKECLINAFVILCHLLPVLLTVDQV